MIEVNKNYLEEKVYTHSLYAFQHHRFFIYVTRLISPGKSHRPIYYSFRHRTERNNLSWRKLRIQQCRTAVYCSENIQWRKLRETNKQFSAVLVLCCCTQLLTVIVDTHAPSTRLKLGAHRVQTVSSHSTHPEPICVQIPVTQ